MRSLPRMVSAVSVGVVLLVFSCSPPVQEGKERKTPSIQTVNGAQIFRDYCATCHGVDGRGNGPTTSALRYKVPDLTEISKRTGDKFPSVRIRNIIEGTETLTGHGSREMPIWGPIFHQVDVDQDLGNVRTDNVTRYIESIQQR
jgi:mono/diheme cytochrome c family protein